jgi:hypothetical protein
MSPERIHSAEVNRTVQDTPGTPDTMHSFSIYYVRSVEGLVSEKQTIDEFGSGHRFKLKSTAALT